MVFSVVEFTVIVKELGFPIAAFAITIYTLIYMIKKNEKRQELSDERYEELVNKFIITTKKISDQHEMALENLSDSIIEQMEKCRKRRTNNGSNNIS